MPKEIKVTARLTLYDNKSELPANLEQLINCAHEAAKNAYAPYSNFRVGAAVLDSEGNFYTGNNQENAAYPSGMCAERVALFAVYAQNPKVIVTSLAVIALGSNESLPAPPCGSCRQTILEYEFRQNSPIQVIFGYNKGNYLVANSIEDLLPLSFNNANLKA